MRSRGRARHPIPAGSSADRRRARRRWHRSRTRSPECRARARPSRPPAPYCANSGPTMISAPSSIACVAAWRAAVRIAGVVLDQKLDIRIGEFGERHLGGVAHRLRREPGIARRRQRQDQRDLDLRRRRPLRRPGGAPRSAGTSSPWPSGVPGLGPGPVPAHPASAAAKASDRAESPKRRRDTDADFRNNPDTTMNLNTAPRGRAGRP